jgi:hypothetical protein
MHCSNNITMVSTSRAQLRKALIGAKFTYMAQTETNLWIQKELVWADHMEYNHACGPICNLSKWLQLTLHSQVIISPCKLLSMLW